MVFYPKDFIETAEGLIFAVVWPFLENRRVLCFLRYERENGGFRKYDTAAANALLAARYPRYLFHSDRLDADLHAVERRLVVRHHEPRQRLRQLRALPTGDPVERDARRLCGLLEQRGVRLERMGVTGSILIAAQRDDSDIDLVCYDGETFAKARRAVRRLLATGGLQNLRTEDWQSAYRRRGCALSFAEYCWHERRKFNKALIGGRKFDLSLAAAPAGADSGRYRKHGAVTLSATVVDAARAYHYPAEYRIDHPLVSSVLCFTATYQGQALAGETIEAAGFLEQNEQGRYRLIVGASREAPGEYLKVTVPPESTTPSDCP